MRLWTRISTNSTIGFAAVILGASAAVLPCAAHDIPVSAVETGYPSNLVNRPACTIGEIFDEWSHCSRPSERHGRRRSFD